MATSNSKTKWKEKINGYENLPAKGIVPVLCYEGKVSENDILATTQAKTRALWEGESGSNSLYFGDNLHILASLLDEYRGKVDLVYIDPPFSTGGVFHSRGERHAYTDLLTGATYVEFVRQRIILIKELLSDHGSIYVHTGHVMAPYLKVILDEIFGENRFINWITRKKSNPKNYTRNAYGNVSDVILFYGKTKKYRWNRPFEKWGLEDSYKEYMYIEEGTGRRYKKVPVHAPGTRNGATGSEWKGKLPPPGKHWQFTPEKLDELDAKGEIWWSKTGNPRRKIYLDENQGKGYQDIWLHFRDAFNQFHKITGYPTEKNQEMLELIINSSTNEGDLVLDCFAGSGTTLVAASKLKRNWIGIDNSREAIQTTLKRFVFEKDIMGDFVNKRENKLQKNLFAIRNFCLYVDEHYENELDSVMSEWKEWMG